MKIKDFLEENKGKNFIIEVENGIIKKVTIEEMKYEIKNDELYLINGSNLDFAVINLNIIRNFNVNNGKVVIFLEDKKETKIRRQKRNKNKNFSNLKKMKEKANIISLFLHDIV